MISFTTDTILGSTLAFGKRAASGSLTSVKPAGKATKSSLASKDKILEDNYIHHLQQQIQILELETRLRSTASVDQSISEAAIKGISPLEEMLRGLKRKYSEMQESHDTKVKELEEKITDLLSQIEEKNLIVQEAKRERDEIKADAILSRGKCCNMALMHPN